MAKILEIIVTHHPQSKEAEVQLVYAERITIYTEYKVDDIDALLAFLTTSSVAPTLVMATEPLLKYDSKFLKVYERNGYAYSERLGRDSIAFILYDANAEHKYGLIHEGKPPLGENVYMTTAFGGSLDSDKSPLDTTIAEVAEEAGYIVDASQITALGNVLVSTQMNQMCHLFLVDVTDVALTGRTTTDPSELLAKVVWCKKKVVRNLPDWKAVTILAKAKLL